MNLDNNHIYQIKKIEELNSEKKAIKKEAALQAFISGAAGISLIAMHKISKTDIDLLENILAHIMIISIGGLGFFKLIESLVELTDIEDKEELLNQIKSLNTKEENRGKSL